MQRLFRDVPLCRSHSVRRCSLSRRTHRHDPRSTRRAVRRKLDRALVHQTHWAARPVRFRSSTTSSWYVPPREDVEFKTQNSGSDERHNEDDEDRSEHTVPVARRSFRSVGRLVSAVFYRVPSHGLLTLVSHFRGACCRGASCITGSFCLGSDRMCLQVSLRHQYQPRLSYLRPLRDPHYCFQSDLMFYRRVGLRVCRCH
jgi:hypothetical protein